MKCRTEMRFLFVALFVLVGLAVPVAAAAFSPVSAAAAVTADSAAPSRAGVESWITNAPPPVLVMLLGTLIVTATVMRHLRVRR
ncbi:MAG TPA: hypothetical protein VK824_12440, partial [Planctomycetota bacterium]|nr:hypothetical protein [Planctomycetota bacterium]